MESGVRYPLGLGGDLAEYIYGEACELGEGGFFTFHKTARTMKIGCFL